MLDKHVSGSGLTSPNEKLQMTEFDEATDILYD